MNKKLFSTTALMLSVLSGCVFTSCLDTDDDDRENIAAGYFTTDGNASQIILHQDGGGTVLPLMSSFKDAASFLKNERYLLQFKYRKGDISADEMTVTGAEIIAGEMIDVHDVYQIDNPAVPVFNNADSLFAISSISNAWAYRGYLTVLAKAYYSMLDSSKGVLPTYNVVVDPANDVQPNRVRLTLCYNRHTAQDAKQSPTVYELATSFRLSSLASIVPGNDSVEISIEGKALNRPTIFKVSRAEFQKSYK